MEKGTIVPGMCDESHPNIAMAVGKTEGFTVISELSIQYVRKPIYDR